MKTNVSTKGTWEARCFDKNGEIKWLDNWENLVVNEGLDYALDVALAGGTQITTWYVSLTSDTPVPNATHTMASHTGWTEVTAYSEATRPEWVSGTVLDQSVDNAGVSAKFTGDTDGTTVGGAILVAESTKGGTTDILFSVGAFEKGNKPLDEGDTLEVTAKYSNTST